MDKTPKILTIIGLIFEGIGVLGMFFGGWIMINFEHFPGVNPESMNVSQTDFDDMLSFFHLLGNVLYILGIITVAMFVLNLYLFIKLILRKWSEETAKKVYLYQAIWGGINILFNQITGIMYLISGVSGYSGHREETNIREGI